jgi:hypothetical protein
VGATASVYLIRITAVAATASVVLEKPEYDYESIPAGALRATLLNPAGAVIGGAPLMTITRLSRTQTLDQIGSIMLNVPATDPLCAYIDNGTHLRIYHRAWGYLGEYVVSTRRLSADQATYEYKAWSLLIELGRLSTFLRRQFNDVAVTTVISTGHLSGYQYGLLYGTGWTPGTFDAGMGNVVVEFNGQSILEAIGEVCKRKRVHFREGTSARTLDVGALGVDSGYRLIAPQLLTSDLENNTLAGIVESVSQEEDGDSVVNCVIALGGGQGDAALTLEKCTKSSPYVVQTTTNPDGTTCYYISDATSVATYGAIWRVLPMTMITPLSNSAADIANAANAVYDAAVAYLLRQKDEHINYRVSAINVPSGLKVGDQVRLVYRGAVTRRGVAYKWVDIDSLFWVITHNDELDASGAIKTSLELANIDRKRMEDADVIIGALQAVQVMQTFVQPYPSAETFVYREEIAPSHTVTLPIEIDSRVLYLNSCKVRVQTRPLRSTITATAGGGGTTVTSAAGGGSTVTSAAGGGQTTSSGGGALVSSAGGGTHQHNFKVWGNGVGSDYVKIESNILVHVNSGNIDQWTEYTTNHTHTISVPSHTHTVADHTHSITIAAHTHSITLSNHTHGLTYGIYDDTAYPATVSLAIDGVDRTAALGGPWAVGGGAMNSVLDITTYLVNASGGLRQAHTLVFSCTGGLGQMVVTIRSLMTTQAIAVA